MTQAQDQLAERAQEEIWELTIAGRVSVEVTNHLGHPVTRSERGKGSRLRISTHDRLIAQERVRSQENDPFTNGMLVRIDSGAKGVEQSVNALTDEDLGTMFMLEQEQFEDAARTLSQVNIRRLVGLAPLNKGTVSQVDFLKDFIQETWPIGGDTLTWRQMQADPSGFA